MVTPTDYLSRWPENQLAQPSASSWGEGGYSDVWLCEQNDWFHERLYALGARLVEVCRAEKRAEGLTKRALTQAVREHLLAQASDWPFQLRAGAARAYAEERVRTHLEHVAMLLEQLERRQVDEPELDRMEGASPIFPWLSFSVYS